MCHLFPVCWQMARKTTWPYGRLRICLPHNLPCALEAIQPVGIPAVLSHFQEAKLKAFLIITAAVCKNTQLRGCTNCWLCAAFWPAALQDRC